MNNSTGKWGTRTLDALSSIMGGIFHKDNAKKTPELLTEGQPIGLKEGFRAIELGSSKIFVSEPSDKMYFEDETDYGPVIRQSADWPSGISANAPISDASDSPYMEPADMFSNAIKRPAYDKIDLAEIRIRSMPVEETEMPESKDAIASEIAGILDDTHVARDAPAIEEIKIESLEYADDAIAAEIRATSADVIAPAATICQEMESHADDKTSGIEMPDAQAEPALDVNANNVTDVGAEPFEAPVSDIQTVDNVVIDAVEHDVAGLPAVIPAAALPMVIEEASCPMIAETSIPENNAEEISEESVPDTEMPESLPKMAVMTLPETKFEGLYVEGRGGESQSSAESEADAVGLTETVMPAQTAQTSSASVEMAESCDVPIPTKVQEPAPIVINEDRDIMMTFHPSLENDEDQLMCLSLANDHALPEDDMERFDRKFKLRVSKN